MIVVGIDPGRTGGCALIESDRVEAFAMPPLRDFAEFAYANSGAHFFLEKAQSFPGGGVSGMFNYGLHFGELLGVLCAYDIAHTLVVPGAWSRVMHAGTKGIDTKRRSIEAATRLFPAVPLIPPGSKARKPHLGITEALLIAEYGRRFIGK